MVQGSEVQRFRVQGFRGSGVQRFRAQGFRVQPSRRQKTPVKSKKKL